LVAASEKALPLVPPFSFVAGFDLGQKTGVRLSVDFQYKSSSSSNLFGGGRVPPYSILSAIATLPVKSGLAIQASARNILNVLWARDVLDHPLPGFEFFVGLEAKL
jgi:hypothetical protein